MRQERDRELEKQNTIIRNADKMVEQGKEMLMKLNEEMMNATDQKTFMEIDAHIQEVMGQIDE